MPSDPDTRYDGYEPSDEEVRSIGSADDAEWTGWEPDPDRLDERYYDRFNDKLLRFLTENRARITPLALGRCPKDGRILFGAYVLPSEFSAEFGHLRGDEVWLWHEARRLPPDNHELDTAADWLDAASDGLIDWNTAYEEASRVLEEPRKERRDAFRLHVPPCVIELSDLRRRRAVPYSGAPIVASCPRCRVDWTPGNEWHINDAVASRPSGRPLNLDVQRFVSLADSVQQVQRRKS